jgi:uncharacterized protein (DUF362 family)/Pyruvate/2-oxoacid:ferredoxin oxidoreductase delta subunit
VAIVRCADYDPARVRAAVGEAVRLLPWRPESVRQGATVLLKPNLLSSNDPPERAVNTHPAFVKAVAEMFIARGHRVLIGDSCGSLSPGSTAKAIATTGLDRVAAETGAEIVDFDKASAVEVEIPDGRILKKVKIPKIVREVDFFVTLPKFKTHSLTLLTGAVKNQFGLIAGKGKKDLHLLAPKPALMAEALLDIHSVARPHLALMDAVLGMEGNGPAAGRPRGIGLILAAEDAVSLDAVMAALMGYDAAEVDTVRRGHERRLGIGRMEEITLHGVPPAEAAPKDFAKPSCRMRNALFRALPVSFIRWAFETVGARRAEVLDDLCVRCGECIANCPAKALRDRNGTVRAEPALCIGCYCCTEVCERRAILMRRPLTGRVVHALARLAQGRGK